jgi:hypothetical protein
MYRRHVFRGAERESFAVDAAVRRNGQSNRRRFHAFVPFTTHCCISRLAAANSLTLAGNTPSVSTPVTELRSVPTGVSDGNHRKLRAAPAYGDLNHGPHGTFIRTPAGFVSPIQLTKTTTGAWSSRESRSTVCREARMYPCRRVRTGFNGAASATLPSAFRRTSVCFSSARRANSTTSRIRRAGARL